MLDFSGTPRYFSPEMLRSQPCGRKMDLFALAAVLYEMVEGEPPNQDQDIVRVWFVNYYGVILLTLIFANVFRLAF